jgi:uncharacterized protein (DUF433 family)
MIKSFPRKEDMAPKHASRIVTNPEILGGKPIIQGTRISVDFVLELFESGLTVEEILVNYPHLTRADLRAAVAFARQAVVVKPNRVSRRGVAV